MSAIVKQRAAAHLSRRRGSATLHARSKLSLAVAAALYGAAAVHGVPAQAAVGAASETLEEITVTARKRAENLQDVPQSIDVYTAKDLQNLSISRFEDYATKTPSVSFISIGPGSQQFFMRGVSDGSNPNVTNTSSTGFFVDDLAMSYYGSIPDLHSYDIERIEILNGPQGTLFGAGSMSGAIRVISNKPDPNAFSAGVDVDGGKIDHGGANSTYEAFVNLPIVDGKTAVRLSAFAVHDGGFIDNLLTTRTWVNGVVSTNAAWARNNYNTQHIDGGRAAIKQVFNDDWSLLFTYNYQSQRHAGAWDQDQSRYSPRKVSRFGPENGDNYVKTLDLHLEGDVGIGDLVYASTYWSQPSRSTIEYSEYVQYSTVPGFTAANIQAYACLHDPITSGDPTVPYSGCNVPTQYYVYDTQSQRWSNELRLQSKAGGRIHWLTGLYWEKTKQTYANFFAMPGLQPTGDAYQGAIAYWQNYYQALASPLPEEWYSYKSRFDYLQTTEFADLSFDLTDQWSLEAGVQHFHSNFAGSSEWAGYFWDPKVPSRYTGASKKWNTKAGVNFKASNTLLLYASFSQGFRDGGINSALGGTCYAKGAPLYYQPDTLNNFEIGWKSTNLKGRLTWNGAIYYMPWKNYQTAVFDLDICPSQFNANLGDARVYGAESNVDYKVWEGLSVQVSGSYNDSHLITNTYYNANYVVTPGERLPYVPYFSYSANARYEKPLGPALKGFVQYDIAHKGDMWSDLRAVNKRGFARSLQPSYEISNFRFGIQAPNDHWTAEAYISNLLDKNAVVFTNTGNYDRRQTTNEPRVFGLRLSYRWGGKGGE